MASNGRLTQEERSARSSNALLEAASTLIVEGGFAGLTLAAVGERAGFSRGLVTARFGSKDGLIEALIGHIVGDWTQRNVAPYTEGHSGLEGVGASLGAIRRQAARDPRGLRVLYAMTFEALGPDEKLRKRMADFHRQTRKYYSRLIDRGISDGSISADARSVSESELIVAGLRGIGYQWLLDPKRFNPVSALLYLHDTTVERLAVGVQ